MAKKKVNVELIPDGHYAYGMLADLRAAYHSHLDSARIALAWRRSLRPDVDGRLVLGRCQRASDLQREISTYDFIILLNQEAWDHPEFGDARRKALLDHELCHAEASLNEEGDQRRDERGRPIWRTRKHDIEEFREIVERHGLYKQDLEKFAQTILRKARDEQREAVTA